MSLGENNSSTAQSTTTNNAVSERYHQIESIPKQTKSFTQTITPPNDTMTLDQALEHVGFGPFQWILLLLSGVGFFSLTIELLMTSLLKKHILKEWSWIGDKDFSLLACTTFAGKIIGGIIWGSISDIVGRRPTFIGTACVAAISAGLAALAPKFWVLVLTRFLLGIAFGGSIAIDFVYFVEFIPRTARGIRTTIIILLGICAFYYTGLISYFLSPFGWRWLVFGCSIPNILLFIGRLFWKWESPRFLAVTGQTDQAIKVFKTMCKWNGVSEIKNISFSSVIIPIKKENERTGWHKPYVQILKSKHIAQLISTSIVFFCQTFAYYGLMIWIGNLTKSKGIEDFNPPVTFALIGTAQLFGLLLTTILLAFFGRRLTLFLNFFGSAIGTLFLLRVEGLRSFWIVMSTIYFFIVGTWTGLYITTPEIFPTTFRTSAVAIAGTFGKIGGLISPFTFGILWDCKISLGWILSIISVCFLAGSMVSLTCRETKDANLSDT